MYRDCKVVSVSRRRGQAEFCLCKSSFASVDFEIIKPGLYPYTVICIKTTHVYSHIRKYNVIELEF